MRRALFIASYDSRHFEFEGVGDSEAAARDVLKQGLREHGKQCGLIDRWWRDGEPETEDEFFPVREIEMGTAYRDGAPLPAA